MKPRDQLFRIGSVNYLKSQVGDLLSVDNATISGGAGTHCDSTVTFEQSGSYIKINFGTSTSNVAAGMGRMSKYLIWDTGFTVNQYPMISLSMDCSASAETDMTATTASNSLPAVAFGVCIYSASLTPIFEGSSGRWNDGNTTHGGVTRYTAWRMGLPTDRINWDSNEGDTDTFNFTNGSNGVNGTAAGCRGFRTKVVCSLFPRNTGQNVLYRWDSIGLNPGNNCDGNNEQVEVVTTADLPLPDSARVLVWIGAGNTSTGGGPCEFAGIFKARVL